ncbi:MAG: hypothetical protein KGZ30_00670 [Anaplasmataceae bacterium]|nr:hypothetical protein [Anaplasmataceae bacterium]
MKRNYRAWEINFADYSEELSINDKIKFFLKFGVLAPSSHNSQPWSFKIQDGVLEIHKNRERKLPFSDSDDRQLYISLGCAIENIVIAADYCEYSANVQYVDHDGDMYARIYFDKVGDKKNGDSKHLIFLIPKRVNNRNKYKKEIISNELLSKFKGYIKEGMRIDFVSDERKKYLAKIAIKAGIRAMEYDQFREELSHYVKNNMTKSEIGMPGFGMGIPTPISFFAPFMVKMFNMNALSKKSDLKLLSEHTPVLVVISMDKDDPRTWMDVGRVYERIALEATSVGLSTAVWAAPIQIDNFYQDLQRCLNILSRPQMFFRLGRPEKITEHSPRIFNVNIQSKI